MVNDPDAVEAAEGRGVTATAAVDLRIESSTKVARLVVDVSLLLQTEPVAEIAAAVEGVAVATTEEL